MKSKSYFHSINNDFKINFIAYYFCISLHPEETVRYFIKNK